MSAVIPDFRIDDSVIEKDAALLEKLGVKVFYGREVTSVKELQEEYDAVILAVGAYKRGQLKLDGKEVRNALEFLEEFNRVKGTVNLGKHVVVIGGGNTAMDTARAAKRCAGESTSTWHTGARSVICRQTSMNFCWRLRTGWSLKNCWLRTGWKKAA